MKKKILGLAFIAMSLVTFNGMAQNNADSNTQKQENVKNAKGRKGDKKERRPQCNPFEGMQLTDAQQAQLKQLDSQRKAAREQQALARKENKQRNDSAKLAERRASRKSYLDEVKAIIGPDQYVVFLENMYVNGGGHNHDKPVFSKTKDGKTQGDRPDRKNGKDHHKHHASNRNASIANKAAASNS